MIDPQVVQQRGYLQVVGTSTGGQTRYRALRAATVLAQWEMVQAARALGLPTRHSRGFPWGAFKCGEQYHPEWGLAEVCLRMYLNPATDRGMDRSAPAGN